MIQYILPHEAIIKDVAKVHVRCWQEAYAGLMDADFLRDLSVERRAENWRKTIDDPEVFSRVALDGNSVVGFASSGPSNAPDHADGELYAIYVLASHHGKGIGSALFKLVQNDWRRRGGKTMLANVLTENARANAFYKYMGGEIVAQKPFEMAGMRLLENVFVFPIPSPNRD